jgi:hypothetical protein
LETVARDRRTCRSMLLLRCSRSSKNRARLGGTNGDQVRRRKPGLLARVRALVLEHERPYCRQQCSSGRLALYHRISHSMPCRHRCGNNSSPAMTGCIQRLRIHKYLPVAPVKGAARVQALEHESRRQEDCNPDTSVLRHHTSRNKLSSRCCGSSSPLGKKGRI